MRNRFALLVAVYGCLSSGCLYHNGYYPNGYGPGPSVLPSQPWTGYPTTPTYPPGTYPPGVYQPGGTNPPLSSPTPISPGTQPAFPSNSDPSTYGTPGNNSAPPFNPSPNNGNNNNGVPLPDDNTTGFNTPPSGSPLITPTSSAKVPDDESTPFSTESTRLPRTVSDESVADSEEFPPPIQSNGVLQTSGSDDGGVDFANTQAAAPRSRIYGHGAKFDWLQGIVEYDEPNNCWVIMFDDNPSPTDSQGGEFTLVSNPKLNSLRAGDVYRVEGSIDRTKLDGRDRPMYRATLLKRLPQSAM